MDCLLREEKRIFEIIDIFFANNQPKPYNN